ncbi:putative metabolite transport protein YwtG [Gammaproteobacteria bacterium]
MQMLSLIKQNKYSIYLVVFVAAFSGLLVGFNTAVASGAILFIEKDFPLTAFNVSLIVSSVLFGAFVSAMISGRIADYYGRRRLMMFNALLFFCGSLCSFFAPTVLWLIISRTMVGFATGISSYVAPLYISELAPFRRRGIMVGFAQLFIVIGILISYAVDYVFAFGGHWRLMFGIGTIPALMLFAGLLFVPESPRWLVANDRDHEAREVLQMAHADTNVELELFEIKESLNEQRNDWRVLFKPWVLPAAIVGFGIAALQQLVGISIFIYYSPAILVYNGGDQASTAILTTFGIGILLVFFTIIALPLIDRWGRRPLLLLGSSGMTLSLLVLSAIFRWPPENASVLSWLAVIVYISSFAVSFGPIGWLMITELFPLRIRGLATSLATATIWGVNMLVVITFIPMVKSLHLSGVFWLYGVFCFLSLLFVYFLVPETKKITLERIEANLRSGKKSRYLGE